MRQRGFSLVEFMIAMTIGLVLLSGLVFLIAQTSNSRAELERSSRQIENGRYAMDRIAEDLRHAGYYGEFIEVPGPSAAGFPATLAAADPCLVTVAGYVAGLPLPVQAYDGGTSSPLTCIAAGDYQPGTDVLVVRRASTTTIAKAAAFLNQPYLQTTPLEYKLDRGGNLATFSLQLPSANNTATVDAQLHRWIVRIYFVAKCNVPASGEVCNGTTDDGGRPIPTLKMLELGQGGTDGDFQKLALAEGIEHLQIDFGIDSNGDGVPESYKMCDATEPCTTADDWANVVTAQVSLVARNTEFSPEHKDTKTYSLGRKGYTTATNDQYRRHAYASAVRLNNVSMRRER